MRLAILGTRGVPPEYGGFETFAAELGSRLARRGHSVTVYCRETRLPGGQVAGLSKIAGPPGNSATRQPDHWHGIRRIVLPHFPGKYFETVTHTMLSALDALRRDFDVILLCNAANAFTIPLLRVGRMPVAINVDGIERKRRKWNVFGQAFYATGEAFAATFASAVVADADVIADYYRANYSVEPVVIPYGAEFPAEEDTDVRQRLGIEKYILYVSRFEPENNPLEVVLAYEKLKDAPPLVMLGAARYDKALEAELRRHASPKIIFPGGLYGADYRTLQRRALVYIQATEVGGTHPALIEAMASGGLVLANDTPENREVGGDAIRYFQLQPRETLSGTLRECLASGDQDGAWRERARRRASERFGWEAVTDAYEMLLTGLVRH
ncbi:MAG TPA: glycosyltransferase [Thermoanaerobaculia bacterium]|nr:glycosyltransferase [Thermoanaerobaculia bacterium]